MLLREPRQILQMAAVLRENRKLKDRCRRRLSWQNTIVLSCPLREETIEVKDQKIRKLLDDIDRVPKHVALQPDKWLHAVSDQGKDSQGVQLGAIPEHFFRGNCACAGSQCHAPKYSAIAQAADSRARTGLPGQARSSKQPLPLFRMGLNTPALSELGDRWAGQWA